MTIGLYWTRRVRRRMIHGRGRPGDVRWTARLSEVRSRSLRPRLRFIGYVGSFLMRGDGRVDDGEGAAFLAKATAKARRARRHPVVCDRRRIERGLLAKLQRPMDDGRRRERREAEHGTAAAPH
jgi:hypothetical protein